MRLGTGNIAMPRAIRTPAAPKIAAVHIAPMANGYKVSHHMTAGAPTHFVFKDPSKMLRHLSKIQANHWRDPGSNEGAQMARALSLPG